MNSCDLRGLLLGLLHALVAEFREDIGAALSSVTGNMQQLDRTAEQLSQIAIVKTVGGIVFPGHPLAASKEELEKIPGYWPDLDKSRAEAKKLLEELDQELQN